MVYSYVGRLNKIVKIFDCRLLKRKMCMGKIRIGRKYMADFFYHKKTSLKGDYKGLAVEINGSPYPP